MYIHKPFDNHNFALSPAEKRTLSRHHLIYYLRIWDAKQDQLLGHVADVSTEGFLLVGEEKLPKDKEYDIVMRLPVNYDNAEEAESISFKAVSCWSTNDVNKQFFDTGFRFTDISEENIEKIINVIGEYGI